MKNRTNMMLVLAAGLIGAVSVSAATLADVNLPIGAQTAQTVPIGSTYTLNGLEDNQKLSLSFTVKFGATVGNAIANTTSANSTVSFDFGFAGSSDNVVYADIDLTQFDVQTQKSGFYYRPGSVNMTYLPPNWTPNLGYGQMVLERWASPKLVTGTEYTFGLQVSKSSVSVGQYDITYLFDGKAFHTLTTSLSSLATQSGGSVNMTTVDINSIAFRIYNGTDMGYPTYITGIDVSVLTIPEPATWFLLTVSAGLLGLARLRKTQK